MGSLLPPHPPSFRSLLFFFFLNSTFFAREGGWAEKKGERRGEKSFVCEVLFCFGVYDLKLGTPLLISVMAGLSLSGWYGGSRTDWTPYHSPPPLCYAHILPFPIVIARTCHLFHPLHLHLCSSTPLSSLNAIYPSFCQCISQIFMPNN